MATRKQRYIVDPKKKTVSAIIEDLNEKELNTVKNYIALGFTLNTMAKVVKTKEEMANSKYGHKKIEEYIEANGTKEQIKKFREIKNEKSKSGKINPKTGKPFTKGWMGQLTYFKECFPEY